MAKDLNKEKFTKGDQESKNAKKSAIKKIFSYIGKYKILIALSIIFAVITVILSLYIPIIIGEAIDEIIDVGKVNFEIIKPLLLKVGVIAICVAILQWIMGIINNKITFNVVRDIRNDAFERIEALPLKYIDSHSYGEIVNQVISDVDQFADGLLMGFTQLFTGIVTIIATLVFMLTINVKITLVVVLFTPLSLIAANFISKRTYNMFKLQSKTRAEQTAITDEMISNLKVVKSFSHEDEALEEFDEINERLKNCSIKAIFFSSTVNPTTRFINALIYASVALVGAFSVIATGGASITVGALSCFLNYSNQYSRPFNEISGVITELQNALACASRIFALIEEPTQEPDKDDAIILKNPEGCVNLENVYFSYDPDKKLIENLNLYVQSGKRIAIVGPTGCGKTTVINLLMRFYDVNDGAIFVDGNDIRDITRHSLRQNYGMVLQETWIKHASVKENISIGKPDATDEEIIEAAKASYAHSFIKRLPNGYDTIISEDGSSLSQGQKQLLCIARVMLCLPPMLILDEATSSIDTRTEIKIQEAFAHLMRGRTSFIVAHRLSTIREADTILVMNAGKIIEQGNHETLLGKKGFYYKLYNSQFETTEEYTNEKN